MIIFKDKKEIILKVGILLITFLSIFVVLNAANDNAYLKELVANKNEVEMVAKNGDIAKFGNDRGAIWALCFDIISKHPLIGVGPDSLGSEVRLNYVDLPDYSINGLVDKAHNEYLHIAVTTGIPSAIIYIVFLFTILVSLLMKYIKNVKEGKVLENETMIIVAVTGSIVAYMIQAIGNISIFAVAPLFWAMLGIGANISYNNEN